MVESIFNVSASEFITVVNSDRQTQSDKFGKWFSAKDSAKELKRKAKKYLDVYKKYTTYLEAVAAIPVEELEKELFVWKFSGSIPSFTPEEKQMLLEKLQ